MGEHHCSRVLQAVHDTIRSLAVAEGARQVAAPVRLLDVGCWDGESTARYGAALAEGGAGAVTLAGIEVFPEPAAAATRRGIEVTALDLEREGWPYPAGHFDVVVCNQVLEHLKNIWRPLDELARVTRADGTLLVSVPNLASLHNRALLALGRQPTSIRIVGPHVRGYALHDFLALLQRGGHWQVQAVHGVGFPPLPVALGNALARLWPHACHTPVVVCRRTAVPVEGAGTQRAGDHQTYYE